MILETGHCVFYSNRDRIKAQVVVVVTLTFWSSGITDKGIIVLKVHDIQIHYQ